jgi:superfamily I DNA/RNA helicase
MTPTPEQDAIVSAATDDSDLAIEALAGTGKTSTLVLIARALRTSGQYMAFNQAIVRDAKKRFPTNVRCNTAHSLAFRATPAVFQERLNKGVRMTRRQLAEWLDCKSIGLTLRLFGYQRIEPWQVARLADETVRQFCRTADDEISDRHVPAQPRFDEAAQRELVKHVLPLARRMWSDLTSDAGVLVYRHEHYLKQWQLRRPTIAAEFILFDESQDADPVMLTVANDQDAQLIHCGDSHQTIYDWRGAVNAFELVATQQTLPLTSSFRFGPAIADEANEFLGALGSPYRVQGVAPHLSRVGPVPTPHAIICRTNGGVANSVIATLDAGRIPAVVGGTSEIIDFAEGCAQLIRGERTGHRELAPFHNWDEVLQWVQEDQADAGHLATFVKLIVEHGVESLIGNLRRCVDEATADVVVSTAHRSKGREWPTVKLHSDFPHRDDMDEGELRLAYVAVTRAREVLDKTSWTLIRPASERTADLPNDSPTTTRRPRRPPIDFT